MKCVISMTTKKREILIKRMFSIFRFCIKIKISENIEPFNVICQTAEEGMGGVRSRMKNELEYRVNEKQENSIRLKV